LGIATQPEILLSRQVFEVHFTGRLGAGKNLPRLAGIQSGEFRQSVADHFVAGIEFPSFAQRM